MTKSRQPSNISDMKAFRNLSLKTLKENLYQIFLNLELMARKLRLKNKVLSISREEKETFLTSHSKREPPTLSNFKTSSYKKKEKTH